MAIYRFFRFQHGSQVHLLIALDQQVVIPRKALRRRVVQFQPHARRAAFHSLCDDAHAFASLRICSILIINTAMSPGDTPETRCAAPNVSGRSALSFCRASMRKPVIFS